MYERKSNMKPIFCIDVTLDKDNECSNGDEFLRKSISKEDAQRFTDSFASVTDAFKKAKLPLAFRILEWVLGFYALIVVLLLALFFHLFTLGCTSTP